VHRALIFILAATSVVSAQSRLNSEVERIMKGHKGTAIVLDLKTEKVIAVYHPEVAARRLALPGSTVKPFTLMALIDSGKVRPDEKFVCRREVHVGKVNLTCSHPQTGQPFDAVSALAYSCNDYFTSMATRLTAEEMRNALTDLSKQTRLLPDEVSGSVQLTQTREQRQLQAVGEFGVRVTPIELLAAYRRLSAYTFVSRTLPGFDAAFGGLMGATEYGMARLAQPQGLSVAGKTGTSRADEGTWTHGWFVGWAPASDPQVALVVFLERGTGPGDAAPFAAQILQAWMAERK